MTAAGGGRHDADAQSADDRCGQPGQQVTRPEVEDPPRTGALDTLDRRDPVNRVDHEGLGLFHSLVDVDSDDLRPAFEDPHTVGEQGGVVPDLDSHRVEHRRENRSAPQLALALGGLLFGDLLAIQLESGQLFRRAGEHNRAPPVADGQHRRHHRAHVAAEILQQFGDVPRLGVGDGKHRRPVTQRDDAAAAGDQCAGRPAQLSQCEQLYVLGPTGPERRDGHHALRVAGQRDRRGVGEVHALTAQGAGRGDLGQQHTGNRHRRRHQLAPGRHRLPGRQRSDPAQRLEADGPNHDEFVGHRFQQVFGFIGDPGQFGLDTGGGDDLLEAGQPRRAALPAERHGVRFTGVESIHKRVRGGPVPRFHAGGQPVVLVNRHSRLLRTDFAL